MKNIALVSLSLACSLFTWNSVADAYVVSNENGIRPALPENCYAHMTARRMGISIEIASKKKGLGAFATQRIPMGTLVGVYGGEIMSNKEVKARYWGKREMDAEDRAWVNSRKQRGQGITGNYLVEMPNGSYVDGEDADISSWCRFMNHAQEGHESGNCNVKAFTRTMEGDDHHDYPRMYAIEDIEVGEELCWDYGQYFFIGGIEAEDEE
mmetsp:Transcript_12514/g.21881  ORF Transcript_12514/g.21881 Transcript_12514/m.21881 type:complete len:210 (-) Transcript_12514:356-985(-)